MGSMMLTGDAVHYAPWLPLWSVRLTRPRADYSLRKARCQTPLKRGGATGLAFRLWIGASSQEPIENEGT